METLPIHMARLKKSLQLLADNPDIGRSCDDVRKSYQHHEYKSHS